MVLATLSHTAAFLPRCTPRHFVCAYCCSVDADAGRAPWIVRPCLCLAQCVPVVSADVRDGSLSVQCGFLSWGVTCGYRIQLLRVAVLALRIVRPSVVRHRLCPWSAQASRMAAVRSGWTSLRNGLPLGGAIAVHAWTPHAVVLASCTGSSS